RRCSPRTATRSGSSTRCARSVSQWPAAKSWIRTRIEGRESGPWSFKAYDQAMDEPAFDFERAVQDVVDSLPDRFRAALSNVEIVVDDEPPPGSRLLGLYQGIPLTKRTHWYAFALPDKISIYRGPIERLCGGDPN